MIHMLYRTISNMSMKAYIVYNSWRNFISMLHQYGECNQTCQRMPDSTWTFTRKNIRQNTQTQPKPLWSKNLRHVLGLSTNLLHTWNVSRWSCLGLGLSRRTSWGWIHALPELPSGGLRQTNDNSTHRSLTLSLSLSQVSNLDTITAKVMLCKSVMHLF